MLPSLPLRRRDGADRPQRFKRGVYPAAVDVHGRQPVLRLRLRRLRDARDFDTAALLIGIAMVLDTLDGFVARLTNSSSAFGVQLDSLADVVSFGLAPAILAFTWGLWPLEAARLGGRLHLRDRDRDAAGALQHPDRDGRPTSATSSACRARAAAGVIASTVYLYPVRAAGPRRRRCRRSRWCWCRRC